MRLINNPSDFVSSCFRPWYFPRFIQPLEHNKLLVLIDDSNDNKTRFYVEDLHNINQGISKQHSKIQLSLEKIGTDFLVTVDEAKRFIALFSPLEV